MKLRLRKNSIRLRLLQSEVKMLGESGIVSETISFAPLMILTYSLKKSAAACEIFARFSNEEITIEIPAQIAENWIETNLIGIENDQRIDHESTLKIVIEKDFICVERPFDPDNIDAYPHPKINC